MGLGAPLRWIENRYLARYLRGRGIEIGALWRRFPVHRQARVYYVDRSEAADLKTQYADVRDKIFRRIWWPMQLSYRSRRQASTF